MPRVMLYREKYMKKDFMEFVFGRMKSKNLSQKQLGQLLDLSQPAMSNRMNKGLFSYGEIVKLFKILDATDEEILRLMKE